MNIEEGLRTPSKSSKQGTTSSPSTGTTTTTTRSSAKKATKNAKITNFFTKVNSPLTRNSSNSNQEHCENDIQQSDELSKDASSSSMKAPESCIGEICKRKGKEYVFIIPSSDDDTNTSTKGSTNRRRKPPSVHSSNSKSSDGMILTSTNNELGLGTKKRNLPGDKQDASSNQEALSSTPTRSSGRDSRSRDSLPEKRLKIEGISTINSASQSCSPGGGQRITRIQPTLIRSRTKMIDFQSVPSDLNLPRGQAASLIEKLFLVKMPEDFFLFWDFAKTINHRKPCSAFSHAHLDWNLVGPYDVLSGLITDFHGFSRENLLRHCRYYYDPPELQTVIVKKDSNITHYGYFRDDPDQDKPIVVMNRAAFGCQLQEVGDNLFTLLRAELDNSIANLSKSSQEIPAFSSSSTRATRSRSNDSINKQSQLEKAKAKQELTIIRDKLIDFCSSHENISGESWSRTDTRRAKVRTKTLHTIGLVIPKELDTRQDLGLTETKLKTMLNQISESNVEDKSKCPVYSELKKVISRILDDSERCDPALGLELGLNLFCQGDTFYHNDVDLLLNKAYTLLGRLKFIVILKSHLELRKKGDKVSLLD